MNIVEEATLINVAFAGNVSIPHKLAEPELLHLSPQGADSPLSFL
jgi:hypothetical protein